jgi:hypothetical protein
MSVYPKVLQLNLKPGTFKFFVPKFHLPAHVISCQTEYSLNYGAGCGRSDGEGVERNWAESNPIGISTSEMGPGHRRDTLDDHFGDSNWKKTTNMGE